MSSSCDPLFAISPLPLEQFATYVKEQTKWWTTEIKAAGIEPE